MEICAGNPFCTTAPFFNGTISSPSREKPRFLSPSPSASAAIPAEAEKQALAKRGAIAGKTGGGGGGEDPAAVAVAATAIPADIVNLLLPKDFCLLASSALLCLPPWRRVRVPRDERKKGARRRKSVIFYQLGSHAQTTQARGEAQTELGPGSLRTVCA